jgi:hypothetical protein
MRLFVVNPSAVSCLRTALDSQTGVCPSSTHPLSAASATARPIVKEQNLSDRREPVHSGRKQVDITTWLAAAVEARSGWLDHDIGNNIMCSKTFQVALNRLLQLKFTNGKRKEASMSIQKLVRIRTRIQWHGAIICSVDSPIERFQHTRVSLFSPPRGAQLGSFRN